MTALRLTGFLLIPFGFAGATPIDLRPDQPVIVRKVLPADSRVVRGFTHAPVDGREDTRYATGEVGEWSGLSGTPAVNYRVFNGNNGLHVKLAEAGFDAIQVRGDWRGKVYADSDSLTVPDKPALCEIPLLQPFEKRVPVRRLSFFHEEGRTGALTDLSFFQIERQALKLESLKMVDHGASKVPLKLTAEWKDASQGIAAITLKLDIAEVEPETVFIVRLQDVLDARRAVITVDFRVPGAGSYTVSLDIPDQVFLPPKAEWQTPPRMAGPFSPKPKLNVSIAAGGALRFDQVNLFAHGIPRAEALPEAIAWRTFLLRGLFSAMSEPRPWMHLVDGKPVREQIEMNPAIQRYRTSITELLETAEIARLIAPDDALIRQYHDWLYQNIDRRKPRPPPALPKVPDAPRWAILIRENWREQAHIARWWLETRMVPNGELGGGPQDDTDMFQVWQCLPMIESEPLGAELKEAGVRLADIMLAHHLEEGINRRSMDALHAYEEGVNQLALNAWWNYGDPIHFERVMESARSAMKLMVKTEDGRVHFGGDHLGIEEARNGFAKIGASPGAFGWAPARLLLHPLYVVADYNHNSAVLERYAEWGRTWADYQKPGAFVEKVDIKTGKPIKVTDLPETANLGPVEDFLALYQLTRDPEWHRPYQMGVDGGGFTGVSAQYGRATHALVRWPEAYQADMRRRLSEPGAGYAGFFVHQDRALLDQWLADSVSWFQRYRYMNTAAEQKTDRVLTYKATTALSCYLGDAPNRNRWLNLSAVSYEGLRGEDFAALVWDAGPETLRVAIYNFDNEAITGRMRVWRLDHGRYRIRTGPDRDDDGMMDETAAQKLMELQRYSEIPLNLPPGEVTVLEVEQLERLEPIRERADLALSQPDGKAVTIHNIGNRDAAGVRVVLKRRDQLIESRTIEKLEAPLDLYPRSIPVEFSDARAGDVIVLDPDDEIPEIAEHNNRLSLAPLK